jgi:hypothetical protein
LVWKDERHDGKITEAVRLARYEGDDNYVEIKRTDGDYTVLRIVMADAAPQRRACALLALLLLQHSAPSRPWLGVGQHFRMVEQSQDQHFHCADQHRDNPDPSIADILLVALLWRRTQLEEHALSQTRML